MNGGETGPYYYIKNAMVAYLRSTWYSFSWFAQHEGEKHSSFASIDHVRPKEKCKRRYLYVASRMHDMRILLLRVTSRYFALLRTTRPHARCRQEEAHRLAVYHRRGPSASAVIIHRHLLAPRATSLSLLASRIVPPVASLGCTGTLKIKPPSYHTQSTCGVRIACLLVSQKQQWLAPFVSQSSTTAVPRTSLSAPSPLHRYL